MINDSTNVRVIADNIKKLEKMVKEAGSELPTPGVGDTGKILKVGSDGYELDTEYSYTPPAYSSTAEVATGEKWIDGKDVYSKVLTIPSSENASGNVDIQAVTVDTLVKVNGCAGRSDSDGITLFDLSDNYSTTNNTRFSYLNSDTPILRFVWAFSTGSALTGGHAIIYYTKPDPAPTPETTTKKKTTKKG